MLAPTTRALPTRRPPTCVLGPAILPLQVLAFMLLVILLVVVLLLLPPPALLRICLLQLPLGVGPAAPGPVWPPAPPPVGGHLLPLWRGLAVELQGQALTPHLGYFYQITSCHTFTKYIHTCST